MCSPHYTHVMVNSSKGRLGGMDAAVARGPGGGFPTALASAAPESGMWEVMVSRCSMSLSSYEIGVRARVSRCSMPLFYCLGEHL